MRELIAYLKAHSQRGSCACNTCLEPPHQTMSSHAVDVLFFRVIYNPANPPEKETLRNLVHSSSGPSNTKLNLLDGHTHTFPEIIGWIGDPIMALTLMGLGALVDIWKLSTPFTTFPTEQINHQIALRLARAGMLAIRAPNTAPAICLARPPQERIGTTNLSSF
jgi:hypothetical protein